MGKKAAAACAALAMAVAAAAAVLAARVQAGGGQVACLGTGSLCWVLGDPDAGTTARDGGVLAHHAVGDYQVAAYQLHVTASPLKPAWGPLTEVVLHATGSDQLPALGRMSMTAMAACADPGCGDPAADYRLQRESFGGDPRRDYKVVLQQEGGYLVEQADFRADGDVQLFRRTDSPAPAGDELSLVLGQERRGTGPALASAGTQDSPRLVFRGLGHDGAQQHAGDWSLRAKMGAGDGHGNLAFEKCTDGAQCADVAVLTDSGILSARSLALGGAVDQGAGSDNLLVGRGAAFAASTPASSALLGAATRPDGKVAWKVQGEDGFPGWLLAVNAAVTGSDGATYFVVQSPGGATMYLRAEPSLP